MIDAYAVGVELEFGSNVETALARILRQFERLDEIVNRIKLTIGGLTEQMNGMAGKATVAAAAWERVAAAMERANRGSSMSPGAPGVPGGGGGSRFVIPLAPGGAGDVPQFLPAPSSGASGQLRLSGPGGSGGGGGGGGSSSLPEINLPPGMRGGPKPAKDNTHRSLFYAAMAAGIFDVGKDALTDAGSVDQMRARLLAQGVSSGDASALIEAGRNAARANPGITISEGVSAAMDVRQIVGGTSRNPTSTAPAISVLPSIVRSMAIFKKIGDASGDESFAAAKTAELLGDLTDDKTGTVNPANLSKAIDAATRVAVATQGRVLPHDFLAFVKRARVSDANLSDSFLFKVLPSLIMENGGSISGTAEMAAWRTLGAGQMTGDKFAELGKLGLIDKHAKLAHGHVANMDKHLKGYATFDTNPAEWVWTILKPALEKAGITDRVAQAQFAGKLLTNTGAGLIASLILQQAPMQKDMASMGAATTGAAAAAVLNQGFESKTGNFAASMHNLLTDLGGPLIGPAGAALDKLRAAIDGLGQAAHEHPTLAGIGDAGMLGLGGFFSAKFFMSMLKKLGFIGGKGAKGTGAAAEAGADAPFIEEAAGILEGALAKALRLAVGRLALPLALIANPTALNVGEKEQLAALQKKMNAMHVNADGSLRVEITNPHDIASATTTGLGQTLYAAPVGPSTPDHTLAPR